MNNIRESQSPQPQLPKQGEDFKGSVRARINYFQNASQADTSQEKPKPQALTSVKNLRSLFESGDADKVTSKTADIAKRTSTKIEIKPGLEESLATKDEVQRPAKPSSSKRKSSKKTKELRKIHRTSINVKEEVEKINLRVSRETQENENARYNENTRKFLLNIPHDLPTGMSSVRGRESKDQSKTSSRPLSLTVRPSAKKPSTKSPAHPKAMLKVLGTTTRIPSFENPITDDIQNLSNEAKNIAGEVHKLARDLQSFIKNQNVNSVDTEAFYTYALSVSKALYSLETKLNYSVSNDKEMKVVREALEAKIQEAVQVKTVLNTLVKIQQGINEWRATEATYYSELKVFVKTVRLSKNPNPKLLNTLNGILGLSNSLLGLLMSNHHFAASAESIHTTFSGESSEKFIDNYSTYAIHYNEWLKELQNLQNNPEVKDFMKEVTNRVSLPNQRFLKYPLFMRELKETTTKCIQRLEGQEKLNPSLQTYLETLKTLETQLSQTLDVISDISSKINEKVNRHEVNATAKAAASKRSLLGGKKKAAAVTHSVTRPPQLSSLEYDLIRQIQEREKNNQPYQDLVRKIAQNQQKMDSSVKKELTDLVNESIKFLSADIEALQKKLDVDSSDSDSESEKTRIENRLNNLIGLLGLWKKDKKMLLRLSKDQTVTDKLVVAESVHDQSNKMALDGLNQFLKDAEKLLEKFPKEQIADLERSLRVIDFEAKEVIKIHQKRRDGLLIFGLLKRYQLQLDNPSSQKELNIEEMINGLNSSEMVNSVGGELKKISDEFYAGFIDVFHREVLLKALAGIPNSKPKPGGEQLTESRTWENLPFFRNKTKTAEQAIQLNDLFAKLVDNHKHRGTRYSQYLEQASEFLAIWNKL